MARVSDSAWDMRGSVLHSLVPDPARRSSSHNSALPLCRKHGALMSFAWPEQARRSRSARRGLVLAKRHAVTPSLALVLCGDADRMGSHAATA